MTTDKHKFSCYLYPAGVKALDDLRDALRQAAPLELRGSITRSTIAETAIGLALLDWEARGRESDVFKTMVAPPTESEAKNDH